MINNKKGMSTIITTIIMIALALIAVGIVWTVVVNILNNTTDDAGSQVLCVTNGIQIIKAEINDSNTTSVLIKRSQGSDELGGIALIAYDADEASSPTVYIDGDIPALEQRVLYVENYANAAKVVAVPYFKNSNGENILCGNTVERNVVEI